MDKIFTFWEGQIPSYIKLCIDTWMFPYIILNYENLHHYTDLQITPELKRFTLPQIADCVRVHVLRDQGGYWLDADTIMVTDVLPTETMIGNPIMRTNTIGYLHADSPHTPMFDEWATYQDAVIKDPYSTSQLWSIMGNSFTDVYVKKHTYISICDVEKCWPEVYMVEEDVPRYNKYKHFYFGMTYSLSDIKPTNMLMLHNSWTPDWYKKLSAEEILKDDKHTLSNILREVL